MQPAMQVADGFKGLKLRPRGAAVAMGTFDGVHRGHQALLSRLAEASRAEDWSSVVVTFEPRPLDVLRPSQAPPRLTTDEERRDAIACAGVDALVVLSFTPEFSRKPALRFLEELQQALPLKGVFVGYDFRFGAGAAGDAALLGRAASERGFRLEVLPARTWKGQIVSSTRIRQLLTSGDVEAAADLLGRPYSVRGRVIHGDARGRTIGFPTANLELPPGKARPADGVYAVQARRGEEVLPGVANLGRRPTFDGEELRLEVHLFDFQGDLYGETLEVAFMERLRGERRFASLADLKRQIEMDAASARAALGC